MKTNPKSVLKSGKSVVGTMVTVFDNLQIAKIVKVCGFDYFVIDCEHGSYHYSAVANVLAMARETGIPGIVRIPEVKREVILKYMEMGAAGLLLPNTETAEQARSLVEFAKYAPLGNRGVSLLRPHAGYEKVDDPIAYMKRVNEETILMVQIESPQGVKNIEPIMEVEGVDAAFVGPSDLSQSLGVFGQLQHPDFTAAVDRIISVARMHEKAAGIHILQDPENLEPWIKKGMTLNLWANDVVLMMRSAREGLAKIRSI